MNDCDHCHEHPGTHMITYPCAFRPERVCCACFAAYNDGEPVDGIAGPSDPRYDATRGQ